jgi:hypothetical protein
MEEVGVARRNIEEVLRSHAVGVVSALLVAGAVMDTKPDPYCVPGHIPLLLIGVPSGLFGLRGWHEPICRTASPGIADPD